MTNNDVLVDAISRDYREAGLDGADRAMLDFAAKLTLTPQGMEAADIEDLRLHGFDDLAIHDIVVVTSYYAFVNRVADGLGVELETRKWEEGILLFLPCPSLPHM